MSDGRRARTAREGKWKGKRAGHRQGKRERESVCDRKKNIGKIDAKRERECKRK